MTARRSLADPRVRLLVGGAVLAASVVPLRRDRVGARETSVFLAFNHLPESLFEPAWTVMQLGTVGAAPVAAGIARLAGHPQLARRLLVAGVGTWAGSKVVKRFVRRPRPSSLVQQARVHGREAAGLGYPSGHAGVALALVAASWPALGPPARRVALGTAAVVAGARLYVGAHLPLDVLSGAALGVCVEAAVELAERDTASWGGARA